MSRVICGNGFTLDSTNGQHCIDIDECTDNSHDCSPEQICENRQGGYVCKCPAGHTDGPNKDCVDIDECSIYGSGICGMNGRCENTVGSYRCSCDTGFENIVGTSGGMCQVILLIFLRKLFFYDLRVFLKVCQFFRMSMSANELQDYVSIIA